MKTENKLPLGRIELRTMSVAELIPADYNPRRISDVKFTGLKASVEAFGLVQPIVWNENTGNIVGGHQRIRALLQNGVTDTDVLIVRLDSVKEKALNVTLNNPNVAGEFNETALQEILQELSQEDDELLQRINLSDLEISDEGFIPFEEGERQKTESLKDASRINLCSMTFLFSYEALEDIKERTKGMSAEVKGQFVHQLIVGA